VQTTCIRIKLKKDSMVDVRNWFQTLNLRMNETIETLKKEGVTVESVFLDKYGDDDFLIYYMKAKDLNHAREVFKNSTDPIDQYHKECTRNLCGDRVVLEELLNIDLIPQ